MPGKRLIFSLVAVAALLAAVPASATEATPREYKEAGRTDLQGQHGSQRKDPQGRAAESEGGEVRRRRQAVLRGGQGPEEDADPAPRGAETAEDAAQLTKWLGYAKTEAQLFETIAKKLHNDEATAAQKMVVRLVSTAKQANNQVLDYEFRYCRFQPSKFI